MSTNTLSQIQVGSEPTTVVQPRKGLWDLELAHLWDYHELLFFLVWRDVKVRYKQTALGVAWAILQPLMATLIFSIFFGRLAKMPSDGIPYPVFAYVALVPWQYFANALTEASNSLVASQNLIKKVYFPRLIIPLSSVIAGLVDFCFAFIVLIGMMFHYGIKPSGSIFLFPVFLLLAVGTALAAGLWLSVLNVQFRDVKHTIPFLTQFWFFATPIVYPSSIVPAKWRMWYGINPMAGVVEGFRYTVLGKAGRPGPMIWVSAAAVIVMLIGGVFYFRKMESTFADVV
ncbi:MAG TPA: ABC transporter permease [Candidatus Binatia bacterium]|nr:ABC transporter permease [Candidatus Binatia bacterium]